MAVHEDLTLAPAAGLGIGKIVADELLSRDIGKKLADTLERGLTATTKRWIQTGKGEGYWEEQQDTRSQLQAALGIMAHMVGEPVKRIIHQHLGGEGRIDPGAALADSPELAAAVERELQKARWKHSGRQDHKKPKRAQPAELVEPEVSGPAGGF